MVHKYVETTPETVISQLQIMRSVANSEEIFNQNLKRVLAPTTVKSKVKISSKYRKSLKKTSPLTLPRF